MRQFLITMSIALVLGGNPDAFAFVQQTEYNEFNSIVSVAWPSSRARSGLPYYVNARAFPFAESDVLRVVNRSFEAWQDVETSDIRFELAGTGSYRSSPTDGRNVITYDATGNAIGAPAGSGVIAITLINWNHSGQITDSDIIFNGRDFSFSASVTPPDPRAGLIDLQDVMTHEIGHLIGLDHTPLNGRATERPTMNPFNPQDGPGEERTLEADDVAGVTAMYPSAIANRLGSISGRVLRADGSGAFGVHVVAYEQDTGRFVVSTLSGASGNDRGPDGNGAYTIAGLPSGDYAVGIRPVDGRDGITAQNIGGIFSRFDVGFAEEFYDNAPTRNVGQTVVVGPGQVAAPVDFHLGAAPAGFPALGAPALPVNTPDTAGPYIVSAQADDANGSVTDVALIYQVDGGPPQRVPMQLGNDGRFSGSIPGQAAGTVIAYRLSATDNDGNTTFLPPEDQAPLRMTVLAFSGNPVFYVVMKFSGALGVIDSGTGDEVSRIPTGSAPHSVVITPDERLAFVANTGVSTRSSNTVTAIETATHRVVGEVRVGFGPLDMAVSPDGQRVFVSNSEDGTVSVIDATQLTEERRLRVPGISEGPFGIEVGADGQVVYVTDIGEENGNAVFALRVSDGEVVARIPVVAQPRSLALSPDGNALYVSGFTGGVSVIDTRTHEVTRTIDTGSGSGAFRLAPSPNGQRLYVTDQNNGALLVIDLAEGRVIRSVRVLSAGRETRGLAVSRTGDRIYVTNQESNDLVAIDSQTFEITERYTAGDGPRGIAIRYGSFLNDLISGEVVDADADFDGSGSVDFGDFILLATAFGSNENDAEYRVELDLDKDGTIGFSDFVVFANLFGGAVASSP